MGFAAATDCRFPHWTSVHSINLESSKESIAFVDGYNNFFLLVAVHIQLIIVFNHLALFIDSSRCVFHSPVY